MTASSSDLDLEPCESHIGRETSVAVGKETKLQATGVENVIAKKLQTEPGEVGRSWGESKNNVYGGRSPRNKDGIWEKNLELVR